MAYEGVILALDLGTNTGIGDGCPGGKPLLTGHNFGREHDDVLDAPTRLLGEIMERIAAPRFIGDRSYGRGEAADDGLIRVYIERPIPTVVAGVNAFGTAMRLLGAVGAHVRRRGVPLRLVSVHAVRQHFLGFGNAPKGSPKDFAKREAKRVCEALGWEPKTYDAADAGALWHWASFQENPTATPPVGPLWLAAAGRAA